LWEKVAMAQSLDSAMNPFDADLPRTAANFQPLTPLTFLERSAAVYPGHAAIIHGRRRFTYAEFYARCRRLASALRSLGIGRGDTVSTILPIPPPCSRRTMAFP